jgi:hypothetical protein
VLVLCLLLTLTGGDAGPVDRHVFDMVINHRGQFLIDAASSFVALGEAVPLLVICILWGAVVVVPLRGRSNGGRRSSSCGRRYHFSRSWPPLWSCQF